jgi:hypothetical protein
VVDSDFLGRDRSGDRSVKNEASRHQHYHCGVCDLHCVHSRKPVSDIGIRARRTARIEISIASHEFSPPDLRTNMPFPEFNRLC